MGQNGAYNALCDLKKAGVIHNIGVASHNTFVLRDAIKSCSFDTVQLPYNLIETSGEGIIDLANNYKIPTIIMKPYAGGSLTKVPKKLYGIVRDDRELKRLALYFIYNQPVTVVIPGCSMISEMEENLGLYDEIKNGIEIDSKKNEIIREIVGKTFCRRCQYCEPCPQNIEISKIFRFLKYFEDYGLEDWAKQQYKELRVSATQCAGCKICETKCPYALNIVDTLSRAHKILGE